MEAYRYINGENEMLQRAKIEFGAGGVVETKRMGIEVSNRGFAFFDFMGSIVPIDEFENIPFRFVSFLISCRLRLFSPLQFAGRRERERESGRSDRFCCCRGVARRFSKGGSVHGESLVVHNSRPVLLPD